MTKQTTIVVIGALRINMFYRLKLVNKQKGFSNYFEVLNITIKRNVSCSESAYHNRGNIFSFYAPVIRRMVEKACGVTPVRPSVCV